MKPSRFSALRSCALVSAGLLTLTSGSALAADFYWDGTNTGTSTAVTSWGDLQGWSTLVGGGSTPGVLPGSADIVTFRANSLATATAQTVQMNGERSVQQIKTANQTSTTTITAPTSAQNILRIYGTPSAVTAGRSDGITHEAGGLTIGSTAEPVAIYIHNTDQTWTSKVDGSTTGAAAVNINGSVNVGGGVTTTLRLAGSNTGTAINGAITDGNGKLNLELNGTASQVWTLTGTNTYTGTTSIKSGMLRITRANSISATALNAGLVSVDSSSGTLALRVGPGTFTPAEITNFCEKVVFTSGGALAFDTINSAAEINGGLKGTATQFRKLGANPLILNGPNTYTSTTANAFKIEEGNVAIRSITGVFGTLGKVNVTGANSALLALVGPGNMPDADVPSIAGMTTSTTANIGISTAAGDSTYSGGLFGARRWTKGDPGTLLLLGNRSDAGGVQITGGTLQVASLPSVSGSAPFGLFDANDKLRLNGGRFMYTGPGLTTDRAFSMSASATVDSSGYGPLVFTGAPTHNITTARTLTLSGYAPGESRFDGVISAANALAITKQGGNTWTLAGANLHTGNTRNNGGMLKLDYTTNDPVSTGAVQLNSGELRLKGKTTGTSETFSSYQVGVNQHTAGILRLEGRMNLTITSLVGGGQAQRMDLIDLYSDPASSLTVSGIATSNATRVVKGVLQANAATEANARANIVMRDTDGVYSFPNLSGTSSGTLTKTTLTNLTGNGAGDITFGDLNANYRVTKGEFYHTDANPLFHTITFDSTASTIDTENEISLSLMGKEMAPSGPGRGVLIRGNNKVTLSNNFASRSSSTQPIWFHNYLTGDAVFNLNANFDGQYIIFGGPGLTLYNGLDYADNFFVLGGFVRLTREATLAPNKGNFRIAEGGVLEVAADLYSNIKPGYESWNQADFVKPVQIAETGGIAFYGNAGISGYASSSAVTKRVFHFGTVDPDGIPTTQALTWGAGRFLTQPDSETDGDYTFKMSSPKSNVTTELRNSINLNGRIRNVDVANGSAAVDAVLAGVLSGSDASGFIKSGLGTLQLTGQNTYKGETRVQDGTLMIGVGNLSTSSSLSIITPAQGGSGKVNVTGDVSVASVTIDGVAQPAGKVTNANVIGTGALYVGAALTPYQQWAAASSLGSSESAGDLDPDFDGIKNVIEYAVGSNPKASTPSVLTKLPGTAVAVSFNRATSTPVRTDLTLVLESSTDLGSTWTTLATSTGGAAMVSSLGTSITVSETSGTVTVTDNRTPVAKTFYRLRATVQ